MWIAIKVSEQPAPIGFTMYTSTMKMEASDSLKTFVTTNKIKKVPLHAMKAIEGRGDIAPTHSRPRY
jgi:hypothetical protein